MITLIAQLVKNLPAMQETPVWFLGQEDPLEKEMANLEKEIATHSSILTWKIPWTEKPGGLQAIGSHRVGDALGIREVKISFHGRCWEWATSQVRPCYLETPEREVGLASSRKEESLMETPVTSAEGGKGIVHWVLTSVHIMKRGHNTLIKLCTQHSAPAVVHPENLLGSMHSQGGDPDWAELLQAVVNMREAKLIEDTHLRNLQASENKRWMGLRFEGLFAYFEIFFLCGSFFF